MKLLGANHKVVYDGVLAPPLLDDGDLLF